MPVFRGSRRVAASGATIATRAALASIGGMLWPGPCLCCGGPLTVAPRCGVCAECWAAVDPIQPPFCPSCGQPAPGPGDPGAPAAGRCGACARDRPGQAPVRAAVVYQGAGRRLLLLGKSGHVEILEALGRMLARVVRSEALARDADLVVAVPSHPLSWIRRGCNPARVLARAVARGTGLPLARRGPRRRLLSPGSAGRQGRLERHAGVRSAFAPGARDLRGIRVLLVDDVVTTGATARACAGALREMGAAQVRVVAWARTPLVPYNSAFTATAGR